MRPLPAIFLSIMGLFSFLASSSAEPPPMKIIHYRGVADFRVPASWKEEYSDLDGATFYEDKPDSGTFRLKVITLSAPAEVKPDSAVEILNTLKQVQGKAERRPDGNALARSEQVTVDRGHEIKIFYWFTANALPPAHARICTFSYTILKRQENDPQVKRELEMLDREIRAAKFSPEVGVTPK